MQEDVIKDIISKVNNTLSYFDYAGNTSARRTENFKERCPSLEKYVECRFNYEFGKLIEFSDLFSELEGCVFTCTLQEPNIVKRNFKLATLRIEISKTLLETNELLNNEVKKLEEWLGGNTIEFTHKKKKFKYKIIIQDEEDTNNCN